MATTRLGLTGSVAAYGGFVAKEVAVSNLTVTRIELPASATIIMIPASV